MSIVDYERPTVVQPEAAPAATARRAPADGYTRLPRPPFSSVITPLSGGVVTDPEEIERIRQRVLYGSVSRPFRWIMAKPEGWPR